MLATMHGARRRSARTRASLAGASGVIAIVLAGALPSCRSATEITVVVTTDFRCSDLRHVNVMIGTLGDDLERDRSPTTTSARCVDGYVGKVVVVPTASDRDEVGRRGVAGFATKDAEQCAPDGQTPPGYGTGCIVERRALHYLPHTPLTVNVVLYKACDGIACGVAETCDNQRCVPARIADSSACQGSGCDDPVVTPPGDAGPPPLDAGGLDSLAATCGDMSGLQAGAPWPMSGFCPTRRSRSPYVGAQTSTVKWTFPVPPSSDVAIAADGTLYYGAFDGALHALDASGASRWSFPTSTAEAVTGSPAIAADGTVYFGAQDHNLYAITPTGASRWSYPCGDVVSPPNVGGDGTIYFTSKDHMLHAVDPQGKKRWETALGGSDQYAQPVLSVDGATLYVANFDGNLYAFTSAKGARLWEFDTPGLARPPAVAPDGTIYFGSVDKNLYALTPDGKKKWAFLAGEAIDAPPALGADGTIYAAASDGKIYAIDPRGGSLWSYASGRLATNGPTVGADGTIYFMAADGAGGGFFAVDPQGHGKWNSQIYNVEFSPSIASDGTVYGDNVAFGP